MQEKVKARLLESRLLAPSGRGGGASSRNLAFAFSCMSVNAFNGLVALRDSRNPSTKSKGLSVKLIHTSYHKPLVCHAKLHILH